MIKDFNEGKIVVCVTHDKYGKYTEVNDKLKLSLQKDFEQINSF